MGACPITTDAGVREGWGHVPLLAPGHVSACLMCLSQSQACSLARERVRHRTRSTTRSPDYFTFSIASKYSEIDRNGSKSDNVQKQMPSPPWLRSWQCNGLPMAVPWHSHGAACATAMTLSLQFHGTDICCHVAASAMALPWHVTYLCRGVGV